MSDRIVGSTVIATERLDALFAGRAALRSRIARLEAALRPFARPHYLNLPDNFAMQITISVAVLRAAAAALADAPGEEP